MKDPKIIGTLGHMIFTGRPDTKELKNKIAAFLYQASASNGIPNAINNYACCLRHGFGMKKDQEKAADSFYKSLKAGFFESRELLDELIPYV